MNTSAEMTEEGNIEPFSDDNEEVVFFGPITAREIEVMARVRSSSILTLPDSSVPSTQSVVDPEVDDMGDEGEEIHNNSRAASNQTELNHSSTESVTEDGTCDTLGISTSFVTLRNKKYATFAQTPHKADSHDLINHQLAIATSVDSLDSFDSAVEDMEEISGVQYLEDQNIEDEEFVHEFATSYIKDTSNNKDDPKHTEDVILDEIAPPSESNAPEIKCPELSESTHARILQALHDRFKANHTLLNESCLSDDTASFIDNEAACSHSVNLSTSLAQGNVSTVSADEDGGYLMGLTKVALYHAAHNNVRTTQDNNNEGQEACTLPKTPNSTSADSSSDDSLNDTLEETRLFELYGQEYVTSTSKKFKPSNATILDDSLPSQSAYFSCLEPTIVNDTILLSIKESPAEHVDNAAGVALSTELTSNIAIQQEEVLEPACTEKLSLIEDINEAELVMPNTKICALKDTKGNAKSAEQVANDNKTGVAMSSKQTSNIAIQQEKLFEAASSQTVEVDKTEKLVDLVEGINEAELLTPNTKISALKDAKGNSKSAEQVANDNETGVATSSKQTSNKAIHEEKLFEAASSQTVEVDKTGKLVVLVEEINEAELVTLNTKISALKDGKGSSKSTGKYFFTHNTQTCGKPSTPHSALRNNVKKKFFKTPSREAPKALSKAQPTSASCHTPSTLKSSLQSYDFIQSPISAYIHNSPAPTLISNKNPPSAGIKRKYFPSEVTSSPINPEAENKDPNFVMPNIPNKTYKSGPVIKMVVPETSRLPHLDNKMRQLIDSPRIIVHKHEGRVKLATLPGKDSPLHQIAADHVDDSAFMGEELQDAEVSIITSKYAKRKCPAHQ